jgi:hypothetical protein
MRKTLITAALIFGLCCPALAGEMHTPAAPAPPPPASATPETTGDEIPNDMPDGLTEIALDLLALLPSLL